MARFRLTYDDPATGEPVEEVAEFFDWVGRATLEGVEVGPVLKITAREWADDWADAAPEGATITELKD